MRYLVLAMCVAFWSGAARAGEEDLSAYYGFGEIEIVKLDWGVMGLRIADFDGDGRKDIAVSNNVKSRIEILLQRTGLVAGEEKVAVDANDIDINALSTASRFERQYVAVSQKMWSFVCGDLNGDGLVDLAFYGEPKGLYVILQKAGEGSKKVAWRTRQRIGIEDGLVGMNSLACADLNNDGASDLILAGREGVYVVLQAEDGTLDEPVKYPTTAVVLGVEVADIDGDGANDLCLVTSDGQKPLHVRFGVEGGQLGPQVSLFIEKPFSLEFFDIDGLAGDEVVTVDSVSGRLLCHKYSTQSADSDWPVLLYPLEGGDGGTKRDLAVADVTGDGLDDVVVSSPGSAELVLYRQMSRTGLGEAVRFPSFSDITSIAAADVVGVDGKSEIAVLSVKEKAIGISRFEDERLSFPKLIDLVGEPLAMDMADVDGDGGADCVYVCMEDGDKRLLRFVCDVGGDGKGHAWSAVELKGLASNPEGLKVIDADQDGLSDVLIFVSYELPILARQVESGRFELADAAKSRGGLLKDAQLRTVVSANVDGGDGEELLVLQKNFARSIMLEDGKSWTVVDQYNARSTENQLSAVAAFKMGGESGRPSILLLDGQKGRLQVLESGKDNTYRFSEEIEVGKWSGATHLKILQASLTGGSDESILLFDGAKFAIVTPASVGGGGGILEEQFSYETQIKGGGYANFAAGDINGDGRADLVMVDYRRNHIEILGLDSDWSPVAGMRFKVFEQKSYRESSRPTNVGIEPRELAIADVTGDGRDDLVTIIHDRIIVYPQD